LVFASSEGLVNLADPKGLTLMEELWKQAEGRPQVQGVIRNFQDQLKKKVEAAAKPPAN
jgi:DNA-binding transcriptional regulator YbjK